VATIDFSFDFGSPNGYLSWKVLPAAARRAGAEINLIPCLLGGIFKATNNRSPMEAFGEVRGKLAYEALETRRFVEKHGLTSYRPNPHFPVNTLLIMRGLIAARRAGSGATRVRGRIMIPSAAPYIFTGLRIGIGLSWLAIVAAEMLTGGVGIGFFIWDAWNSSRLSDIVVALVYIGIVGFVLDRMVAGIGHLATRGTQAT